MIKESLFSCSCSRTSCLTSDNLAVTLISSCDFRLNELSRPLWSCSLASFAFYFFYRTFKVIEKKNWKPFLLRWAYLVAQLVKKPTWNAGDPGLIPGLERSAGEGNSYPLQYSWSALVAQLVKNLTAMEETWVRSLVWEDPLEKGRATHSSTLAWRIPWTV